MVMMHANDLLDQRIIDKGSFVPNLTSGSIIDTLGEIIELMNTNLTERNLEITLEGSLNSLPKIAKFDKRRLQQILVNLLSNGIKYS